MYGDFMILRAIVNIQKGEEILISYVPPTVLYLERKSTLAWRNMESDVFVNCDLCKQEEAEPEEVHNERQQLRDLFLQKFRARDFEAIRDIKTRLENLIPEPTVVNFSTFWINPRLAVYQMENRNFEIAAMLFEESYRLSYRTCLTREAFRSLIAAINCYALANDVENAGCCMDHLEIGLTTIYGTYNTSFFKTKLLCLHSLNRILSESCL